MSGSVNSRSFRDVLRSQRPALADQLVRMEEVANRVWIPHMRPDAGSHAGWNHLKNVERNADKMIPDMQKERFSSGEIFLLLSAVLLHDVGRVAASATTCPFDANYCCANRGREDKLHPCWSELLIRQHWNRFGLPDDHIANYCALLSAWHGMAKPPSPEEPCKHQRDTKAFFVVESLEPYGTLRLPLVSAILRIADETENNWTRAIDPIWLNLASDRSQDLYKAFRRGIEDIEFCVAGQAVIYYVPDLNVVARPKHGQEPGLLRDTTAVLENWGQSLLDAGVEYKRALVNSGGRFYASLASEGPQPVPLARAFPSAGIEKIWSRLKSLYYGTLRYDVYSWASLETALAPPVGVDLRWLLPLFTCRDHGISIHAIADRCKIQLPEPAQIGSADDAIIGRLI